MLPQRINQTPTLKTKSDDVEICVLINSIFFFLSYVFITRIDGHYRLLAILNNRLVHERLYNSLRGAKIAFSRLYQDKTKTWKEGVKAEWTPCYTPDGNWLKEKIKIVEG